MSSSFKSTSKTLRDEGNALFVSVNSDLAPVLQKSRFEKALYKYNQALYTAQDIDDEVSALKNIAVVSSKITKFIDIEKELPLFLHYCKNVSDNFSKCYNQAQSAKSNSWKEHVLTSLRCFLEEIGELTESMTFHKKLSIMEATIYSLKIYSLRAEFCFQIAEMCFHQSVIRLNENDFKRSLASLSDCYRPIEEFYTCKCWDGLFPFSIDTLKEDIRYQRCRAESLQALNVGDKLYTDYCKEENSWKMDIGWDILDWYKKAVLLTRELEVEIEAIATSRIGRIYATVLKMKPKARESFKLAIELALSMQPRRFDNADWYKECTDTLERYQKEQVEQESEVWNKERQKYLSELKEELNGLKENARKSDLDLLTWVYKSHPPKKQEHCLPENLPSLEDGKVQFDKEMKTLFRKAVIHYHPDRSDPEVNGLKWKVLCEEICKAFTCRYETFKSVS